MIGKQLGQYTIVEHIGAGGMGEVYRARDEKLDRDVAIKMLPDEFARDPERLDRFEREAKLLAAVNHPNIAVIHGLEEIDGLRFLALELVEGEGLDERIAHRSLGVEEALDVACQIAKALEAAHAKGIVHRDLKPANVKLSAGGHVKVLDFGLAKALGSDETGSPASSSTDITRSPTRAEGTRTGVILGTVAYMSPEQARGGELDKRTDIWSFGCVLFEMLAGKRPFAAQTPSDAIATILKDEPDWSALPGDVSHNAPRVLHRCLQKDPDRRFHDVADVRLELESSGDEAVLGLDENIPTTKLGSDKSQWIMYGTLVLAAIVTIFTVSSATWNDATPAPVRRATITLPEGREMPTDFTTDAPFVLSPLGNLAVYSGIEDGQRQLYARRFDSFESRPINGTEGGTNPFFSPDGEWVGFLADGWIRKVPVEGGVAVAIHDVGSRLLGATWTPAGTVVFTPDIATGLHEVSAAGGDVTPITTPDRSAGIIGHAFPSAIPDTDKVVFAV